MPSQKPVYFSKIYLDTQFHDPTLNGTVLPPSHKFSFPPCWYYNL